jgi:hypothetical protein
MVENAHLPDDLHGYDFNKRAAVYPFLAKHLGLDPSMAMDAARLEEGIVMEDIEDLYLFDESFPFPENGIRNNEDVVWK